MVQMPPWGVTAHAGLYLTTRAGKPVPPAR